MALVYTLLLTLLAFHQSNSQGFECQGAECDGDRGTIFYNANNPLTSYWTVGNRFNFRSRNFVFIVRNIVMKSSQPIPYYWLNVGGQFLIGAQDRIVVREAAHVFVHVFHNNVQSFQIDYYVGCQLFDGQNASFTKTATAIQQPLSFFESFLNPVTAPPTCWIVIPTITSIEYNLQSVFNTFNPIQVHQTNVEQMYLTLENVTEIENATVQVTDLLRDSSVMTLDGNESFAIRKFEKPSSPVIYEKMLGFRSYPVPVAAAVLINLTCQHTDQCDQMEFKANAVGLKESDLECIKENRCRFNIEERELNCSLDTHPAFLMFALHGEDRANQLVTEECPAFQLFLSEAIQNKREENKKQEIESRSWLQTCQINSLWDFCKTQQCGQAKPVQCSYLCVYIKYTLNKCKPNHNLFG